MKRKLNKVGKGTLTVSLPSKFVDKYNLVSGMEINLSQEGRSILLSPDFKSNRKKVRVDMTGVHKNIVGKQLEYFYVQGCDEIEISFKQKEIIDLKRKTTMNVDDYILELMPRFIGYEIVHKSEDKIVIHNLIEGEERSKIDIVQKRILYLLKDFKESLILNLSKQDELAGVAYEYHEMLARFIFYYMRLLTISDYPDYQKQRIFAFYRLVDNGVDYMRYFASKAATIKSTPKSTQYAEELLDFFIYSVSMMGKKNSEKKLAEYIEKRYDLFHRVRDEEFTKNEWYLLSELTGSLMLLNSTLLTMISYNEMFD